MVASSRLVGKDPRLLMFQTILLVVLSKVCFATGIAPLIKTICVGVRYVFGEWQIFQTDFTDSHSTLDEINKD